MARSLAFVVAAAFVAGAVAPAAAKEQTRIDPSFVAAEPSPALQEIASRSRKSFDRAWRCRRRADFSGSKNDLRAALKKSLDAFKLDAPSIKKARYVLSASAFAFNIADRPAAKSTTALASIGYRITDRATGEVLFQQSFETGFTARAPRKGKRPTRVSPSPERIRERSSPRWRTPPQLKARAGGRFRIRPLRAERACGPRRRRRDFRRARAGDARRTMRFTPISSAVFSRLLDRRRMRVSRSTLRRAPTDKAQAGLPAPAGRRDPSS